MPCERTEFPARGSIPEFDCIVIARRQRLPVRRKGDGMNLVVVAGERLKQPSRAHPRRAPSDHHLTGDQLAVRRKNDAEDLFRVAFESGEQTARRYFPNLDRAVFARGGEKAPSGERRRRKRYLDGQ